MYVIPHDWQNKIELHIVTMQDAHERAQDHGTASQADMGYIAACHDFIEDIETTFGGLRAFDQFLKSDIQFALSAKGYTPALSDSWDDLPKIFGGALSEAEFITETYNTHYKKTMNSIMHLPSQKRTPALTP